MDDLAHDAESKRGAREERKGKERKGKERKGTQTLETLSHESSQTPARHLLRSREPASQSRSPCFDLAGKPTVECLRSRRHPRSASCVRRKSCLSHRIAAPTNPTDPSAPAHMAGKRHLTFGDQITNSRQELQIRCPNSGVFTVVKRQLSTFLAQLPSVSPLLWPLGFFISHRFPKN